MKILTWRNIAKFKMAAIGIIYMIREEISAMLLFGSGKVYLLKSRSKSSEKRQSSSVVGGDNSVSSEVIVNKKK